MIGRFLFDGEIWKAANFDCSGFFDKPTGETDKIKNIYYYEMWMILY